MPAVGLVLLSVLSFLVLPFLLFLLVSSAPLSLLVSLSLSQWKASQLVRTDLGRTSRFQGHGFDGVAFTRGIFGLYAVGGCLGSSCSCDPLWPWRPHHVGRSGLYAVGCCVILCVRGRLHSSGHLHRGNPGLYAVGRCLCILVSDDSFFGCCDRVSITHVLPRSYSESMS